MATEARRSIESLRTELLPRKKFTFKARAAKAEAAQAALQRKSRDADAAEEAFVEKSEEAATLRTRLTELESSQGDEVRGCVVFCYCCAAYAGNPALATSVHYSTV